MKNILFFLIFLGLASCKKEVIPDYTVPYKKNVVTDTIKKIVEPLKDYTIKYSFDSIPDLISEKLNEVATEDQLRCLIYDQKNTYVKAVAIDALFRKDKKSIFEVFQKTLNCKDQFVTGSDCLRDKMSLSQLIAISHGYSYPENRLTEKQAEINLKKFLEIVFQQTPLNEKKIEELTFLFPTENEEYYDKIKEAMTESKSKHLLLPLSRFKRKEDIELIKSFGEDAFKAIAEFPDDQFLDMFLKYIKHNDTGFYRSALAKYPKKKTEAIERAIDDYNKTKTGY
ncbi:hypothetical protein NAT51_08515 [Flavobacterium amniphilum]|uniref:hypothetical protein n=1 Tax=Flavobacterium amniphilum TaxID=1834035 RepID=UPI002029C663|nr:hypothetical protein [Flavobacterium amniphilum]MCL9805563.1 hypothetical protein [Flavobacterium amniphilum]